MTKIAQRASGLKEYGVMRSLPNRARLIEVLNRILGSSKDNEILSSVKELKQLLGECRGEDIVYQAPLLSLTDFNPSDIDPSEILLLFERLFNSKNLLEADHAFLASLERSFKISGTLSEKQWRCLDSIWTYNFRMGKK